MHPIADDRLALVRDDLVALDGQFDLLRASDALPFRSVLDIGFGRGGASVYFASAGKQVTALSLTEIGVDYPREIADQDYPADLMDELGIVRSGVDFHDFDAAPGSFDAIWAAHILEHSLDPGRFLRRSHALLADDGWLLISVPPFKHQVVMGHVCVGWNLGLLMHALVVTGFDVRSGRFVRHGYNIAAFVQKGNPLEPLIARGASYDELSVTAFQEPYCESCWPFRVKQGFEGDLEAINWEWPDGAGPG
ncbi:MAG: class I SAM-dependent methyltransferase [Myxococcota bacterium]